MPIISGGGGASGAAGGDLAGTYPNPTVAAGKITAAKMASGAAAANAVATADGAGGVSYAAVPGSGVTSGAASSNAVLRADGSGGAAFGAHSYTLVQEIITSGSQATVDFTGIAATFRSLRFLFMVRGTNASANVFFQFILNNDSGANYDYEALGLRGAAVGNNFAAAAASLAIPVTMPGASATAGDAAVGVIEFPYYASTTFWKQAVAMGGSNQSDGTFGYDTTGIRWHSTAAINRVTFSASAGNFLNGSTISLWGLS